MICKIHGYKYFPFYYISPGIGVGFGYTGLSLTAKISTGIHNHKLEFINLTYGKAFSILSRNNALKKGYHFLEIEAGSSVNSPYVIGGGAGLAFVPDEKIEVLPKLSLFLGSIYFFRTDHIIYPKYKRSVISSYGGMAALPISPKYLKTFSEL